MERHDLLGYGSAIASDGVHVAIAHGIAMMESESSASFGVTVGELQLNSTGSPGFASVSLHADSLIADNPVDLFYYSDMGHLGVTLSMAGGVVALNGMSSLHVWRRFDSIDSGSGDSIDSGSGPYQYVLEVSAWHFVALSQLRTPIPSWHITSEYSFGAVALTSSRQDRDFGDLPQRQRAVQRGFSLFVCVQFADRHMKHLMYILPWCPATAMPCLSSTILIHTLRTSLFSLTSASTR